jgi:hypothetical protein
MVSKIYFEMATTACPNCINVDSFPLIDEVGILQKE